jgi:type IV conjugative transfer system coupling protein TraD
MPRSDNYSDGTRPGTLTHHSARGAMPRNAGNFTRGSQLITHEFLMWFSSAKLPVMVWFILFCVILSIALAIKLHEHEVQMIGLKVYAAGWSFMEFNQNKIINLTLPSGSVIPAPIGLVPTHPDVVVAWGRFMRAVWGSLFISTFVSVPLSMWFIRFSNRRGKSILEERHQRGAMLVEAAELAATVKAFNSDKIVMEIREKLPNTSIEEFAAMHFTDQKAAGIHNPYNLAGVPFPWRSEQSHVMLVGTTGTGKTTQMLDLIAQMRKRKDRAIVFDLTGAYTSAFYDPETDIILNPMDKRCPTWSVFHEGKTHSDFTGMAAALMPIDGGASEPFWNLAARTLFVETCMKLVAKNMASNRALATALMMADLKSVHKLLANTVADPLTAPEAARMAESIRAVFNTNAQALRFLPEDNPRFSITDWIGGEQKPGSILFITSSHNDLTHNRALLTLWMNLAVHSLMRLPRTRDLRTWFFFDEVHALHRLPAIEDGLQTARGFGGAFILGIHSFAKLSETYGREGAINLTSLARTKLILATADRETAEHCSDYIGQREVRMMDEAYSYGYSNIRDAATITPRSEIQPLVIPDDIMKLPSLRGFLVYPEGFDAARIQLTWRDYPKVAEPYLLRENVEPLAFDKDVNKALFADEEAGGREDNATPEPVIDKEGELRAHHIERELNDALEPDLFQEPNAPGVPAEAIPPQEADPLAAMLSTAPGAHTDPKPNDTNLDQQTHQAPQAKMAAARQSQISRELTDTNPDNEPRSERTVSGPTAPQIDHSIDEEIGM